MATIMWQTLRYNKISKIKTVSKLLSSLDKRQSSEWKDSLGGDRLISDVARGLWRIIPSSSENNFTCPHETMTILTRRQRVGAKPMTRGQNLLVGAQALNTIHGYLGTRPCPFHPWTLWHSGDLDGLLIGDRMTLAVLPSGGAQGGDVWGRIVVTDAPVIRNKRSLFPVLAYYHSLFLHFFNYRSLYLPN